jgi:dTDP-4-dehydrorhamnose 3,5-epimerase
MGVVDFSVEPSAIDGLFVITMKQITDDRGTVREFYRESAFVAAGLPSLGPFVQINATETKRGGLRGFHAEEMTKLVAVVSGSAYGAWIDARPASPTHGALVTVDLAPGTQVLVPKGVANGFQATGDDGPTQYLYCFDQEWAPGMPGVGFTPLDDDLGVTWPLPIDVDDRSHVSDKDRDAPRFADLQGAQR